MHGAPDLPLSLLRLASASLPVGGFAYSRGLEWAVHRGTVRDLATAREWIIGILEQSFATLDGPLFLRMAASLAAGDLPAFARFDAWLAAGRESRELLDEDRRMGEAMMDLLVTLGVPQAAALRRNGLTYPAAFAVAAQHEAARPDAALMALMWSLCDAQVAAAIRLVPLGQTDGQRILLSAVDAIPAAARRAASLRDDDIGTVAMGMAMASAAHETQRSRLFRS